MSTHSSPLSFSLCVCVLSRTKKNKTKKNPSLFSQKRHVNRKHVKIRITCYNADTVLSVLDNIVDNAVTLTGNISLRDDYLVRSDQKPISAVTT